MMMANDSWKNIVLYAAVAVLVTAATVPTFANAAALAKRDPMPGTPKMSLNWEPTASAGALHRRDSTLVRRDPMPSTPKFSLNWEPVGPNRLLRREDAAAVVPKKPCNKTKANGSQLPSGAVVPAPVSVPVQVPVPIVVTPTLVHTPQMPAPTKTPCKKSTTTPPPPPSTTKKPCTKKNPAASQPTIIYRPAPPAPMPAPPAPVSAPVPAPPAPVPAPPAPVPAPPAPVPAPPAPVPAPPAPVPAPPAPVPAPVPAPPAPVPAPPAPVPAPPAPVPAPPAPVPAPPAAVPAPPAPMPAPVASAPAQLSSPPVAVPIVYSQSVYKPIVSSNLVMLKSDAPSEEPEVPLSYGSSDDNWALARIRRRTATETEPARELPADGGKGVHVWMIDSGFDQSYNDEYALRPIIETEFTPGLGAQDTTKGHGTQVASNICSKKYGVAKAAQLHVIAVGTEGPLKEAFQYVIDKVKAMDANNPEKRVRHIIQLSITYQTPDFLDSVIRDANDANIVVVNSAGNGRDNACNYSPGSITGKVPNILTVGSISKGDTISDFTSRGKCVNIFAPGERVPVFKAREHNARVVGIGTSFSAPLTSGVVAIYLSQRVYTTAGQVVQDIIRNATPLSAYGQRIENAGIVYAFP